MDKFLELSLPNNKYMAINTELASPYLLCLTEFAELKGGWKFKAFFKDINTIEECFDSKADALKILTPILRLFPTIPVDISMQLPDGIENILYVFPALVKAITIRTSENLHILNLDCTHKDININFPTRAEAEKYALLIQSKIGI